MLSVRLPQNIETRLNSLSAKTNRSKSFYTVQALERYLEDLEDLYYAEQAHDEFLLSGEKALSSDEVKQQLGL